MIRKICLGNILLKYVIKKFKEKVKYTGKKGEFVVICKI